MEGLRAFLSNDAPTSLAIGGLVLGVFFGFVVQRTNFCTMGSLSDMLTFGDSRRFRAWLLASATAIVCAQTLSAAGMVDLTKSMYLGASLDWAGAVVGGLLFGFGMVFGGGCATRNLVRAGSGDLRSLFVVILIGLSAYATIGGLLGPARAALAGATAIDLGAMQIPHQGLGAILAHATGMNAVRADLLAACVVVLATLAWCFADAAFRSSKMHIVSGLLVGLAVGAGWALTGLAVDEMASTANAPISLTFVRPSGDALEWIERFTAQRMPGFGVASLFGVLAGAWLGAKTSGRLRLATFSDPSDALRNIFGAVLMGVGGVLALGCSIGQGVTGVSTLAVGSILVFVAIVCGGIAGVKAMERLA